MDKIQENPETDQSGQNRVSQGPLIVPLERIQKTDNREIKYPEEIKQRHIEWLLKTYGIN